MDTNNQRTKNTCHIEQTSAKKIIQFVPDLNTNAEFMLCI